MWGYLSYFVEDKWDKMSNKDIARVYIGEESHKRLKLFVTHYSTKQQAALDTIILSSVDEHGYAYSSEIGLDGETVDLLTTLATKYNKSVSDMVKWMCEMAQIYFHEDLSLVEALQPASDLKKLLQEKGAL